MNGAEKKGKCFPFFNRRKTLFFGNVAFFSLTGIQFSLTTFSYCYQTWENKESDYFFILFTGIHFPVNKHALSVFEVVFVVVIFLKIIL